MKQYFSVLLVACVALLLVHHTEAFRVLKPGARTPEGEYFKPYDKGFVGVYGDPLNFQRERINEGAFETSDQELLYEGVSPRQSCPGMVGPFSDGNFYCTAREFGYCDRRSGTCFCNTGYAGIDCTQCSDSHFKVGTSCSPKKLCEDDCSGAGMCNFNNGTCTCLPHRTGSKCETLLCSIHNILCQTCTEKECLKCAPGYYLTGTAAVCSTCYDFDPRCAGCTLEEGCTVCADSTLTSVRRSGYRASDPLLPAEEVVREFGITLPFGTKSPESFADAENYFVATTPDEALKDNAITCAQGNRNDETWDCETFHTSHIVCGHFGVFTFVYPNYAIAETNTSIRMQVRRTGGGHGDVNINYYIKHFTTNDSDVIATAPYTTVQRLSFEDGVIERSFLVTILDDNIVEEDEVFQVVLEVPEGGGSVGAQFRANVTILDNDRHLLSPKLTKSYENTTTARAGVPFSTTVHAVAATGEPMGLGGDRFFALIENDVSISQTPPTAARAQRNTLRQQCNVTDLGNGAYRVTSAGVKEQGIYQLRIWHAFPNSIKAEYFYDGFFERLAVQRLDHKVNFTWGSGNLIPRGSDYISVRWSGAILPEHTGSYRFKVEADDHARLWIDGELILDHWHERYVNLEPSRVVHLTADMLTEVVLEYREVRGDAYARLMWGYNGANLTVVPQKNLFSLFEIDRSPVLVTIISADTAAQTTECTGDGLYHAKALHESHFTVCPRDAFRNLRDDDDLFYLSTQRLSSTLTWLRDQGNNGVGADVITPTYRFNPDTSCFDFAYTPERAGDYRLDILHEGEAVAGSPFYLSVEVDKISAPKSLVQGLNSPLYATAGSCYTFTVVARDNAENYIFYGGAGIQAYMYRVDFYNVTEDIALPPTFSPTFNPTMMPTAPTAKPTAFPTRPTTKPTAVPTSPTIKPTASPTNPTAKPTCGPSAGPTRSPTLAPTVTPTSATSPPTMVPTAIPTMAEDTDYFQSPPSDTGFDVIRDGDVTDLGNGRYTVQLCPVISGVYEIHILLNSRGVSNQNHEILSRYTSERTPSGRGQYYGQYVADSPYKLVVSHTVSSGLTTTAVGPGLLEATAGVPTHFMVTVRDAYDNVMRTPSPPKTLVAVLNRSPTAPVDIWDYQNGSLLVEYIPQLAGPNPITVTVDGAQILGSPFMVPVADGRTSAIYSFAVGQGLYTGRTGDLSYFEVYAFDLDNNRKSDYADTYTYVINGTSTLSGTLQPCPSPPQPGHPVCDVDDHLAGHYFGYFEPPHTGLITIRVYLKTGPNTQQELYNSPFTARIVPSAPRAEYSDVSGTLYDNVAGVPTTVSLQLRDYFRNKVDTGGRNLELALLGVGVEWGTIEPLPMEQGLPNQHFYKGFYEGYPDVYGTLTDNRDGTYTFDYTVYAAGQYVLRLALAEDGLNASYFNGTSFGRLVDQDFNYRSFEVGQQGRPVNVRSAKSWTGDLGRRPGVRGDLGEGSYLNLFQTRTERNISVDLRGIDMNDYLGNKNNTRYDFRDEYWSASWTGMITPEFAEVYTFTADIDSDSTLLLRIGGRGLEFNHSAPGQVVLNISTARADTEGTFNFSDTKYREFEVLYAHYTGDARLRLYWESPSTPRRLIPTTAFTHWRNVSHYNNTIHPAPLCSHCSTAYGAALTQAQVAVKKSFWVYARDSFSNLMQVGGHQPTMLAIGKDGVAFRGEVTDYGNSTYLIEYYPTQAGEFRMYVSIGCCAPHPNIGYTREIAELSPLLIKGAPFLLTVTPAPVEQSRTVAVGKGLLGGTVGEMLTFTTLYRDIHNNPTMAKNATESVLRVQFIDQVTSLELKPEFLTTHYDTANATTTYRILQAGRYLMYVYLKADKHGSVAKQIIASPFQITMYPTKAAPEHTVCRGVGLRQATTNQTAHFEIQLYDSYHNNLITGGNRFHVRLQGDASFQHLRQDVVPSCQDTQNGRTVCFYTPRHTGTHRLNIRLLNNTLTRPGGLGLTATYYTSADAATDGHALPTFMRIDPVVQFSWPTGLLIPSEHLSQNNVVPLRQGGQSVRWDGYLLSPRNDVFYLVTRAQNLNVSIYLDDDLVFDTLAGIVAPVRLVQDAAYHIRITASAVAVRSDQAGAVEVERAIDLRWSTATVREYPIPQFFLYDSATEIALSPFPVVVAH